MKVAFATHMRQDSTERPRMRSVMTGQSMHEFITYGCGIVYTIATGARLQHMHILQTSTRSK